MHLFNLWAVIIVGCSVGLAGKTLVVPSSLSFGDRHKGVAGTQYPSQLSNIHVSLLILDFSMLYQRSLTPRRFYGRDPTDPVIWWAPGTRTYVAIRVIRRMAPAAVMVLLHKALVDIQTHIARAGDGLLLNGIYIYDWQTSGADCEVYTINSNNHQQTWGVVRAALLAVSDYMLSNNVMGPATFTIYDAGTEVGQGTIEVTPGPW